MDYFQRDPAVAKRNRTIAHDDISWNEKKSGDNQFFTHR